MGKKYAAVLDFTPCVRTIKRYAKKQGEIINDKQAIYLLGLIFREKKQTATHRIDAQDAAAECRRLHNIIEQLKKTSKKD